MELRHLRYFVAVADKLSFTEAARLLHIAQPSLSLQIQDLERYLKVTLLERNNRFVRLTPAGEIFLTEAKHLLERADLLVANTHRADRGELGELNIGFIYPAVQWFLPAILKQFHQLKPGISLQVRHLPTVEQEKALQDSRIDIGICRTFNQRTYPDLTGQLFYQDHLCVVVPQDHPLAQQPHVNLADLRPFPLISYAKTESPTLFAAVFQHIGHQTLAPQSGQEPYMIDNVLTMVEAGMGITLAYQAAVHLRHHCQLRFIPLVTDILLPTVDLLAVSRKQDTDKPIIKAFVALLTQPQWFARPH
jgi:DNA-binding transcriptional LysR family regulator